MTERDIDQERLREAVDRMTALAERTGLTSARPSRRYLWTDAFAVCNLLGLARATGDEGKELLALRLVERVHHELGRHRSDEQRLGWISGLSEEEGEEHPTAGGLRIGKPLPERAPDEQIDPDLEWERDGQYFHYLTKWMHALDQVARSTRRPRYSRWARELARTAHRAFTYGPPHDRRMVWKLSIDLSRPLVPSMGHHDPLDGFVTCIQLDATANDLEPSSGGLGAEASDFASMLAPEQLATSDPLGLGGLLVDACRLVQLDAERELVAALLAAAVRGLEHYRWKMDPSAPAAHRLAFRELGLAIGLEGLPLLQRAADALVPTARASLVELFGHLNLRDEIESFWRRPEHRRSATWEEHADINDAMLATSLAPEGFLVLEGAPGGHGPSLR